MLAVLLLSVQADNPGREPAPPPRCVYLFTSCQDTWVTAVTKGLSCPVGLFLLVAGKEQMQLSLQIKL